VLDAPEAVFTLFGEVDFGRHEELLAEDDPVLIGEFEGGLVSVLVVGYGFVLVLEEVAVLVLDLPHDLHRSPLVHPVGEFVLVAVGVAVLAVGEGVAVEFAGDCFAANAGADDALVVDEPLHHRHHVRVLGPDVDHQRALQPEEVGRQHRRLVHEQPVKLVLLEEQLDQLLPVLLAAQRRLDVEERVLRRVHQQLLGQRRPRQRLETLPVVDETVLQDALGVAVLPRKGVEEVHLHLLARRLIDLHALGRVQLTEGATTSGRSLPAKPILVLSEPTSMMRGMP
jgi:hypothetical protein